MDKNTKYKRCPKCDGFIFSDWTGFEGYCFEILVFCDDCGFTWSEVYTFSHNVVEGEEKDYA